MTPEGKIKAKVKRQLDKIGAYYFSPQAGIYGRAGVPDIVGCWKGKYFAIECKAGNNTPTDLQKREMERIFDAGGIVMLINEDNLDEVERNLK